MVGWQKIILFSYAVLNLTIFVKGYHECKYRKNVYKLASYLAPLGIFVWGDAVVFGLFWTLASLISFLLKDWALFLLIISIFWVVRSLGETIYWFNQQFSTIVRSPPNKLCFYWLFQNDSIWFVYQILWQCVTVVSIISSIYFGNFWLKSQM